MNFWSVQICIQLSYEPGGLEAGRPSYIIHIAAKWSRIKTQWPRHCYYSIVIIQFRQYIVLISSPSIKRLPLFSSNRFDSWLTIQTSRSQTKNNARKNDGNLLGWMLDDPFNSIAIKVKTKDLQFSFSGKQFALCVPFTSFVFTRVLIILVYTKKNNWNMSWRII